MTKLGYVLIQLSLQNQVVGPVGQRLQISTLEHNQHFTIKMLFVNNLFLFGSFNEPTIGQEEDKKIL